MPANPTALNVTDPGAFARTAEGVELAEQLAGHIMDQLITMAEIARLDTSITASFMLVEVLSMLAVSGDVDTKTAVSRVKHLVAERVAALRAAREQVEDAAPACVPVPEDRTVH